MDDLWACKLKPLKVLIKKEGLGDAGEGTVRFEDYEFMDVGEELAVSDLENVELVAEDDGIKDSTRGGSDSPPMEAAEVVHGDVLGVVVGQASEGAGRGVPYRTEKVGYLLPMEEDSNGTCREEHEKE